MKRVSSFQFQTFLMDRNGTDFVPLAPFKGNRANVTFYNSAGLYFLSRDIWHVSRGVRDVGEHWRPLVSTNKLIDLKPEVIVSDLWQV